MVKVNAYTVKGVKTAEVALPKEVFEKKVNMDLLAQANHVYEDRSHAGLRSTKTRSEVNRTTKKIYKQKGTGGARHGSRRANLYVGGGIIFGPRPVRKMLDLSASQKKAALNAAFSAKAKAGEIVAVKGVSSVAKTNEISDLLKKLSSDFKAKRFTFLLADKNTKISRFLRNIKSVAIKSYKSTSAYDVITAGLIVIDEDVFGPEKSEKKDKVVKK